MQTGKGVHFSVGEVTQEEKEMSFTAGGKELMAVQYRAGEEKVSEKSALSPKEHRISFHLFLHMPT